MKITDHRIYYKNLLYFIGLHVTSIFQEQKRKTTKKSKASYQFFIIFLSFTHTPFGETTGFCQIVRGFCQKVSLLPNRMRFCQKVSLTPNCIRLSPKGLYFLAKEPRNRSSPAPECKNASKNTRK